MSPSSSPSTRDTLAGTVRVFLAESLLIPTGLLTAAYLARRLGPGAYGLFTVAAAVTAWIEWSIAALFSRATVKLVADASDWRPVGSTIVSAQLALSLALALALWGLAPVAAGLLGDAGLAPLLRLFALDIPLFTLAQAHRNILVGLGGFTDRALAAAARWISRLIFTVLLVELGWSIYGAILACIAASAVELAVARWKVRPGWSPRAALEARRLWGYAAPLVASALALRAFDRLDLMTLSALGGTPAQAGHYAAAQNLAILPSLFALAFSPLVISSLTRALRHGDVEQARRMGRDALRAVLLLLPFAAAVSGAAREIVVLVFGPGFAPAGPLLSLLIFGAVAMVLISVATSILIAAEQPGLALRFTGPLPFVALGGYVMLVPRLGPIGAALGTAGCAAAASLGLFVAVHRVFRATPAAATVMRSILLSALAYAVAYLRPVPGPLVVLQLLVIGMAILLGLVLTGELRPSELTAARSLLRRSAGPA
jgi:O-antigen/teichoic acid export membrane protein